MDRTMNDSIEQRIRELELRIEFLQNPKNSLYLQITLPIVITLFIASMTWLNAGVGSIDKRINSIEKRIDEIESKY